MPLSGMLVAVAMLTHVTVGAKHFDVRPSIVSTSTIAMMDHEHAWFDNPTDLTWSKLATIEQMATNPFTAVLARAREWVCTMRGLTAGHATEVRCRRNARRSMIERAAYGTLQLNGAAIEPVALALVRAEARHVNAMSWHYELCRADDASLRGGSSIAFGLTSTRAEPERLESVRRNVDLHPATLTGANRAAS